MSWDFETDPDFQAELDWIEQFVRDEVEPLEHVLGSPWNIHDPKFQILVRPLQQQVKDRKLWACHLGPELGGPGYGQVKLALINEILGRALFAPIVFGCQAPDSGNAEILAHYGTQVQKARYLAPLLAGDIVSCFAMTEPQGGADPKVFTTRAARDGNDWVISGQKWFASNARFADFFIVMAITDPDVSAYKGMSMFIVPAGTPGLSILRNVGMADEPEATHAYLAFDQVRVPADHMLGAPGEAFVVAQVRLGGGRVHHAMRTIGLAQKALDALCERALSRHTQGSALADKQMVQEKIADSWLELEQFRLLVMRTAWRIDRYQDYQKVRKDIAAVKAAMPKVLHDIAARALHVHGSIGASSEMPFAGMISRAFQMGLADGPTEVHKVTVAKQLLRDYAPCADLFPAYHRPTAAAAAERKFRAALG
ncbi:acyl-CoA dehydrogenase family protein [Paraburkholderia fungorum]|uniref:acyl-CoA dehydrogenase family protein n=1 Tax=Paraburkholderia fungorum TaxID=134537 RepID=UPI0004AA055A|nr:acyl-CoA dehydrogenase family protein [Paraburkholderia fungorum]KFX61937.1 acyl-CoA dehydrogenase [Burkholderia sp. K24]MBU7439261.1 acyl-CoA dehydrogenase family protein [Paraburkholderia fungorum]USX10244.1 acyl-CoA dehydrogenase family protein [Paraburkholderia fungorum]